MDENFEIFIEDFPPLSEHITPDQCALPEHQYKLPESLLAFWTELGWRGYDRGRLWVTDPRELRPILEMWAKNLGYETRDLHVIARTAFGELFIWNQNHGRVATVMPLTQSVFTYPPDRLASTDEANEALTSLFAALVPENVDYTDENDQPLFSCAVEKLGVLLHDEMYAFEPALALGGAALIDNLVKVRMIPHMALLAEIDEITATHIDTSAFI